MKAMLNRIRSLLSMALCLILVLSMVNFAWAEGEDSLHTRNPDQFAKEAFTNTKNTARTLIEKAINNGSANSAGVAIMENGELVYAEGFGIADRDKNIVTNKDTVFNIGSISKLFAATSILLLVDDGKVDLDKPITDYLSEFTMADERYKEITLRMLLNHSSGLPGSTFWNSFGSEYNQNIYNELLATLSHSTLKHQPGKLATYCNDGFTLAEMIVTRVSGRSYGDFLEERIFKPLSMTHTGLGVGRLTEGMIPARYYRPDGKSEPLEVVSLLGSGGISSTTEDLCRFAATFYSDSSILSTQSQMEILKRQPSELQGKLAGDSFPFGLGWDYADISAFSNENLQIYGKTGGTGHYASMLYTVPSQQISVAVSASGEQCDSPGIALNILSAYLEEKGLITQENEAREAVDVRLLPSGLISYEGYYYTGDNTMRVELDNEKGLLTLYFIDGSIESAVLSALYSRGFFINSGREYYFTTVDGTSYFMEYHADFNYHSIIAEKLQPIDNPMELSTPMNERIWLRRNVKAAEAAMLQPTHIIFSTVIPSLPGYIDFSGLKIVKSPDYAGMPIESTRDLTELILVERDGATWAWLSGADYMPAELAHPLDTGTNLLTIGDTGRNEWLKVDFKTTLNFEIPAQGRVIVFCAEGILYDSIINSGDISVPAGSLIEFVGNSGDRLQVTASVAGIFTDIADYVWASEAITALTGKGFLQGISDTSFAPAGQVNRADYMVLIMKLLEVTSNINGNFDDVAENKYYYKEIGAAKALGLTTGMDGINFQPEVCITRQDMFVLAYRFMKLQGLIKNEGDSGVLNQFSDSSEISEYARHAIATLISMGLVKGNGKKINPKGNATRAEIAVFMYRLINFV